MFCKNCGVQNSESAKFCKSCGNGLSSTNQINPPQSSAETNKMIFGAIGIILFAVGIIKTMFIGYYRSEAPLYFCILIAGGFFCYLAGKQVVVLDGKNKAYRIDRVFIFIIFISAFLLLRMALRYIAGSF